MELNWINKPKNKTVVIFVHGILSSGEACWRHEKGAYWPEMLKEEPKFEDLGISVFSYKSNFFSGKYSLNDVVDLLKENLRTDTFFEIKTIIFVCHSMGGIIVRKYLTERILDLIDRKINIGLFLVASPSLGSEYANWFSPLIQILGHTQAEVLRFTQSNTWLNGLDKEFLNLKESKKLKIIGKELIEDEFITLKNILKKQLVEPFSASKYFGDGFKVPNSDHFSIAKPENSTAIQHRLLCTFINEILELVGINKVNSSKKDYASFFALQPDLLSLKKRCQTENPNEVIRELRKIIVTRLLAIASQNHLELSDLPPINLLRELATARLINNEALTSLEYALTITSEVLYDIQLLQKEAILAISETAAGFHSINSSLTDIPSFRIISNTTGEKSFVFSIAGQDVIRSDSYHSHEAVLNAVRAARHVVDRNKIEVKETRDGRFFFQLIGANGQIIGQSNFFGYQSDMNHIIESVRSYLPTAAILI